jgi:hypothetical protein
MKVGSKSGYTKKAIDQWSQTIRQRFDKAQQNPGTWSPLE